MDLSEKVHILVKMIRFLSHMLKMWTRQWPKLLDICPVIFSGVLNTQCVMKKTKTKLSLVKYSGDLVFEVLAFKVLVFEVLDLSFQGLRF